MRMIAVALAATLSIPPLVSAQIPDTLRIGDRVRVNIAASRNYTNVFVGNVASISPDTLVLELPGNKGTLILPRLAIAEVAVADGRESRLKRLPMMAPLLVGPILLATAPNPRSSSLRNRQYVLAAALAAIPVAGFFATTPRERWRPVYGWLYGRTP